MKIEGNIKVLISEERSSIAVGETEVPLADMILAVKGKKDLLIAVYRTEEAFYTEDPVYILDIDLDPLARADKFKEKNLAHLAKYVGLYAKIEIS